MGSECPLRGGGNRPAGDAGGMMCRQFAGSGGMPAGASFRMRNQ
ncbi:hypothetical protein JOC24_005487 [Streptomyces sp. HB132]|nr:hypothetical protein [Streptomyces sp. HB132]